MEDRQTDRPRRERKIEGERYFKIIKIVERERERERERDKQTYRQIVRQTDRQTDSERNKQTDKIAVWLDAVKCTDNRKRIEKETKNKKRNFLLKIDASTLLAWPTQTPNHLFGAKTNIFFS